MNYRTYVELVTDKDILEFANICRGLDGKIELCGYDENGESWSISAKSLIIVLAMVKAHQEARNTKDKNETTNYNQDKIDNRLDIVDYNTLYVESENDIYNNISKFAK